MTYEPKPGDYGVTQIRGFVGKLIRFGQWLNGDGFADYEHAFIYVGANIIVEAEPGGAVLSLLSRYDGCSIEWFSAPEDKGWAIALKAVSFEGTPYSFLDYLALASVRLRLFPLSYLLRRRVRSTGHMICSQLVDESYRRAGVHLFTDGRLPQDVTPGDLLHRLRGDRG